MIPEYQYWYPPIAAYAASVGYGSGSAIPTQSDNVHSCNDTKPSAAWLPISNPKAVSNGDGTYTVSLQITAGTFPLNQVEILIDGQVVSNDTSISVAAGQTSTINFTTGALSSGSHSVTAQLTDAGLYQTTSDPLIINVLPTTSPSPSP